MHGYAVKFSSFVPNQLAIAATQMYGSMGPGALFILNCSDINNIVHEQFFHWNDGLLNTIWSKNNSQHILTSSGDGSLQLWDISSKGKTPIEIYKEHTAEVYAIDWATVNQNPQMLSGAWDGKVKLWDPNRKTSLTTFEHSIDNNNLVSRDTLMIFDVSFSGGNNHLFSSVGTDSFVRIWSLNEPDPLMQIKSPGDEILTCDWPEKSECIVGVGCSNGNVVIYDIRNTEKELALLKSESGSAIRKIKFSPYKTSVLASVSYDSLTSIWDFTCPKDPCFALCQNEDCVCGIDWDPFNKNRVATCGWDSNISIFNIGEFDI